MHDGSLGTLEEVVDFHNRGGIPIPNRNSSLKALYLSESEKKDLVAFLRALSGDQHYDSEGKRVNGKHIKFDGRRDDSVGPPMNGGRWQ